MWWVMYKFDKILREYQDLRAKGFNPAYEFDQFSDLLSYGYAFGEHAGNVLPRIRKKEETMGTVTRILFRPGDWPLPATSRNE